MPDNEFTLLLGMRIEMSTKQHADGFRLVHQKTRTVTANTLKQEESLQLNVCTYLTSSTLCTDILLSSCITHQLHFPKTSRFCFLSSTDNNCHIMHH